MSFNSCPHSWMRVHEQALWGGSFPIGYECVGCGKFVDNTELTPAGIGGTLLNRHKLVGPHGGRGNTADGSIYKYQIIDEDGKLTVVR